MAKVLRCGDVMAGCQSLARSATEEAVPRQAAKHAAEAHHIKGVTPDLAAEAKSKIRTQEPDRPRPRRGFVLGVESRTTRQNASPLSTPPSFHLL